MTTYASSVHGRLTTDRDRILKEVENLFSKLYSSTIPEPPERYLDERARLKKRRSEDFPEITQYEIKTALKSMKNGNLPGRIFILITEFFKRQRNLRQLQIPYNKTLEERCCTTTPHEKATQLTLPTTGQYHYVIFTCCLPRS